MVNLAIYEKVKAEASMHGALLVAVSKTQPIEAIQTLYDAGQRAFGENRPQELHAKQAKLPTDIQWHMIGTLQKNKVKYIAPYVHLIHSVDSLALLEVINKEAQKNHRNIDCLLQVHIAREESKHGFSPEEIIDTIQNIKSNITTHVCLRGLMGMATFTNDTQQIVDEFSLLRQIFLQIKSLNLPICSAFDQLSMGMSGDYDLALQNGSTIIRIGSALFGNRK